MYSPEEIVLSCAKYLRANERRLCASEKASEDGDSSSFSSAFTLGYMHRESSRKNRIFTIEPTKLSIILAKFEEFGLLINGVPQLTPVSSAQSIRTVSSLASLSSLASTFSTLSFFGWRKNENSGLDAKLHFQAELEYIYHVFRKLQRLKICSTKVNSHAQQDASPLLISLGIFGNLTHLDLQKLPPRYFTDWDALYKNLEYFVCRGGIVDLHDLFLETIGYAGPEATWPNLHSIDLSHNDLASLAVEPILSITACESLNLSYNLLLSVPPALTELFRLSNLDLSHNMISNLTGVDRILGNITVLNLSHNKLENLCGLHKLWALAIIDIRGNEVSDVGEVGRLAELPSIQEVYIEGNPLTLKSGYRTEIFSIFLAHELDILLDGTGPSFLEKRQLVTGTDPSVNQAPTYKGVSENSAPTEMPVLKTRKNRPNVRNRRYGKRVADINPDEDPTDSILWSPRTSVTSISEEPEEFVDEDALHQSITNFPSPNAEKPNVPKSPLPTRYKKLFVHRLAELEDTMHTGYSDPYNSTRGRQLHKDGQSLSPRSRSPASVRSSMSALTATHGNESFRKKIEALRNEAGSTWLKIYSEIQHPKTLEKKEMVVDTHDSKDDKLVVGSLPSMLTLVSMNKPASSTNESVDSNESILYDSLQNSPSIEPTKSEMVIDSTPSTPTSPSVESSAPQKATSDPPPEVKKLPDGIQYKVQVVEYSSRTRSKRFIRVPAEDRILIVSSTSLVEVDPKSLEIVCQRGFQGLLRVETKRVGKLMQHSVFRLEFKYRRYDNPTICDYYIADDAQAEKDLQSLLENIVRKNWEEGKGHEAYKQGKCLNCSWVGFLDLEDLRDKRDWRGVKKLSIGLSPASSESESDVREKEKRCPECSGTFLVEFFGREENEAAQSNETPAWAYTSSSQVTNIGSQDSHKQGFFDSWLVNPLGGLTNRCDTKSSKVVTEATSTLRQEIQPTVDEMEDLKKLEKVAGFSPSLPSYRRLTNAIRLHFQLNIIDDDAEKIISWIPASYIPQAPAPVVHSSMWSMMTSSVENMPKNLPTEKPIYIGLTNQSIYLLVPQNIPLPVSTSSIENNPAKHLKLVHVIPIPTIARIDVGPNRQALTVHLNSTSSNSKSASPLLPSNSLTFLIRDKLVCSDFLNILVETCYDHEVHLEDGKVKLVNHDIEGAVKNIRQQVLIHEVNPELSNVPNHHLAGVDPASGQEVVVDRVTFDFIKLYHLVALLMEPCSGSTTAAGDPSHYNIEAFTMIGTEQYIYMCKERHDVWPPARSDAVSGLSDSSTVQKSEGMWGRRKNSPSVAAQVEQYKRVEVAPTSWITHVEKVKSGMNMMLGKEKEGANAGCTATGWEVLVKITFHEPSTVAHPGVIKETEAEEVDPEAQEESVADVQKADQVNADLPDDSGEPAIDQIEPTKSPKPVTHFTWCILLSTESGADELINSLHDIRSAGQA
ncbi:hypothetical protein K493DRAFT_302296 [Basidiobolus meristosporus CBS 931.73]|uniref:L domain-like protein n=1 Tax=Basidiobolus meristosporus CBS 931.73 TaxID=1314790 RepID=A0A1Y1Y8J1_9FUNG|nr:hypothetical protein K493DRAFT_302296 [Basidiobolus meristosporus CBS 931.73]|eukprot:ORX94056.1 hypothetical protein K493DRAFT_302296 [Basidiobolus meristosporus CBS 931.73]